MSPEVISLIPHIQGLIEKLGIVGVLLVILGYGVWDRLRLLKELRATYRARDKWRLAYTKAHSKLAANDLHVDLSDMADLLGELGASE